MEISGIGRFTWGEVAAVAYIGNVKMQASFDAGSTWSDGVPSVVYVGTGTGGSGYRAEGTVLVQVEGTATDDVQVRLSHKVSNTGMDRLTAIHLMAECHQVF